MPFGPDELDTKFLLDVIRNELVSYQQLYPNLPTLELRNVWVNGSFGDDAATESSDFDVTIEIGLYDSDPDYTMKPLYVADRITGMGGPMANAIYPVVPAPPDVTVIPSEAILRDAELNAPTAAEHVAQTQAHGGYSRAFDVQSREYVDIS